MNHFSLWHWVNTNALKDVSLLNHSFWSWLFFSLLKLQLFPGPPHLSYSQPAAQLKISQLKTLEELAQPSISSQKHLSQNVHEETQVFIKRFSTLHQTAFGPTPGPQPSSEIALGSIEGLSEPYSLVRKVFVGQSCWWRPYLPPVGGSKTII